MPLSSNRVDRQPTPGARFPSEVLAANIRDWRTHRRLTQPMLAERMAARGHGWVRSTVSEVERGGRHVTTDELIGLAFVLRAPVARLLDPAGITQSVSDAFDLGVGWTLPARTASAWIRGILGGGLADDGGSYVFEPGEDVDVQVEALRALAPLDEAAERARKAPRGEVPRPPTRDLEAEARTAVEDGDGTP